MAVLTAQAKDPMLKQLTSGLLRVALTQNGTEVLEVGYKRASVTFSPPGGDGMVRAVTNTADVRFGPWGRDSVGVSGWAIIAPDGSFMAAGDFEQPRIPRRGDEVLIRAGSLVMGLR